MEAPSSHQISLNQYRVPHLAGCPILSKPGPPGLGGFRRLGWKAKVGYQNCPYPPSAVSTQRYEMAAHPERSDRWDTRTTCTHHLVARNSVSEGWWEKNRFPFHACPQDPESRKGARFPGLPCVQYPCRATCSYPHPAWYSGSPSARSPCGRRWLSRSSPALAADRPCAPRRCRTRSPPCGDRRD